MKPTCIRPTLIPALLALSLLVSVLPIATASAADTTSTWSKSSTPSDKDLKIVPGSDIIDYAVAGPDGDTIYAIGLWFDECLDPGDYQYWSDGENVQNDRLVPRFWKSSDYGITWKDCTDDVQSASGMPAGEQFVFFSAIAAAPDDPDFVVVAGYDRDMHAIVAGSLDGAGIFTLPGCSAITGEVLCLAVSIEVDGAREIAAGTKDLVNGGRVWRMEVGGYWQGYWLDTTTYEGWLAMPWWTGNEDVFAVTSLAFSPDYDVDGTIVGVALGRGFSPDLASAPLSDPLGYGAGSYPAFFYFAGNWDTLDAWNSAGDFPGFPGLFGAGSLLMYASTYYDAGWTGFFESPFLRMATDIAMPYDFSGDSSSDMVALVSVNGSLVPAAAGFPAAEGGYVFLMVSLAPAFELINQEGNPFVSSVAYHGSVKLLGDAMVGLAFPQGWTSSQIRDWYETGSPSLGCCQGVTVLYTDTPIGRNPCCTNNWGRPQKPPSGQFNAQVAFGQDGTHAYASTEGYSFRADDGTECYRSDESAFSVSLDRGGCWNQSGLIDTDIDFIADVAVSAECGDVVLATINRPDTGECCDCDSVWKSSDNGKTWLRIWHVALQGDYDNGAEWAVLGVAPTASAEITDIYMADLGTSTLYSATFGGLCAWDAHRTVLDDIVDVAALDEVRVYILDSDGRVALSENSGRRWHDPVDTLAADDPGENAHHLVVRGDWLLVGGDLGTVTYSMDRGDSFSILDDIGTGEVHPAFDSYFEQNGYVYAAVAGPDAGVYRTTITAAHFKDMDACDYDYYGIVVSDPDSNPKTDASTGGVLYASYNGSEECAHSGVARLLNPASQSCCGALAWDYLFDNLWEYASFTTQPSDIAICRDESNGHTTIWAIDTQWTSWLNCPGFDCEVIDAFGYYNGWNDCYTKMDDDNVGRLWKFTDCFATAGPTLLGIEDGSTVASDDCECVNATAILEWDRICDACEYDVEIAFDAAFKYKVWTVRRHQRCLERCDRQHSRVLRWRARVQFTSIVLQAIRSVRPVYRDPQGRPVLQHRVLLARPRPVR